MEKERELAISIIGLFEDLLDKYNIDIPSEDRKEAVKDINESSIAHIYGEEYYNLEDKITNLIKNI